MHGFTSFTQHNQPTPPLPSESITYRRTQLAANDLKSTDKLSEYANYNFGPLWLETPNNAVVGFIGPNYQRLRLKILTVQRDKANPTRYYATGKAQVFNHVTTFSGTLVLRQVRELRVLATRIDESVSPAQKEGILFADYELCEQNSQPNSGIFRGVVQTDCYINKQGKLAYDDIRTVGDGFCNNQFVGTWTSFATGKTMRCNWGDYRIPNSGAFDIGAGEFSPNPKYYASGWEYYAAVYSHNEAARTQAEVKEQKIWWK